MIDSIKGFQIEATNICTLKCPGCSRTAFLNRWPQHWKNHSLDVDQLLTFLDIPLQGLTFNICGTYGDPIYHKDFLYFVDRLKNTGARLVISTNGSYKTTDWWHQLVNKLDGQDKIIFGIDGVPENFDQYRVNGDWTSIKQALEVCSKASVITQWKYIVFKYNVDNIDQARALSQNLGVNEFVMVHSDRFENDMNWYVPDPNFVSPRFVARENWRQTQQSTGVDPQCANDREHYISAEGFYTPCCYVSEHNFYYKTMFSKNRSDYDIRTTTLTQILSDPKVQEFYKNLESHSVCQYSCARA